MTDPRLVSIGLAANAVGIAMSLSKDPVTAFGPTRLALELARQILDAEFDAPVGDRVVQKAVETGIYGVADLDRYVDEAMERMVELDRMLEQQQARVAEAEQRERLEKRMRAGAEKSKRGR